MGFGDVRGPVHADASLGGPAVHGEGSPDCSPLHADKEQMKWTFHQDSALVYYI